MGHARPRRLEQDALRHLLVRVFGWEGPLPKNTLCNADVMAAVVQHYATVIDGHVIDDGRHGDELQRLSDFLTEPSVKTLTAIVRAIPPEGRTFTQARANAYALARPASTDMTRDPATPEEVAAFLREYNDRCVVIMLSRGGGFTHGRIAKAFKISRSRCYRYEKWFERLPPMYRAAIIALGTAAAKLHNGGPDAFGTASDFVSSPAALDILRTRFQHAEIIENAEQSTRRLSNAANGNVNRGFWKSVSQAILAPFTKPRNGFDDFDMSEDESLSRG